MALTESFLLPIPLKNILSRFGKFFGCASSGRNATLVALPYTGRTSLMRFILSQPSLLAKLKIDTSTSKIIWVESDKTTGTFESFLSEILIALNSEHIEAVDQYLLSQDAYLISQQILKLITKSTQNQQLIFIVTLNQKSLPFLKDLDNFLVFCQKSSSKFPLNIIWSIDTQVFREYRSSHVSSSMMENIFYFPTFTKDESLHSLKRIANLKGKSLSKDQLYKAQENTGGISGLFHSYVDGHTNTSNVLSILKSESELSSDLFLKLTTKDSQNIITNTPPKPTNIEGIYLSHQPTAQEVSLIKFFNSKIGQNITRDEVAQILWGKLWQQKYSDWAIDKAISRLRNKISNSQTKLITIKNLGYQLIKI